MEKKRNRKETRKTQNKKRKKVWAKTGDDFAKWKGKRDIRFAKRKTNLDKVGIKFQASLPAKKMLCCEGKRDCCKKNAQLHSFLFLN